MKKALLLGSLALNALLIALFLTRPQKAALPMIASVSAPAKSQIGAAADTARATHELSTNMFYCDWTMMESPDYRRYIANLRAIGCPEQTIRDIIIADVNKLFEERARQIGPIQDFDYWKAGSANRPTANAERVQQHIALAQEKRWLLKELLGVDFKEDSAVLEILDPLKAKYGFLPPDKQQQMLELEGRYAARLTETFGRLPKNASDDPRYKEIMAQKEAEMASLLGPQELEDYHVRYSKTAQNMRENFGAFSPTEPEFREIFRQQKQFEDRFGTSDDRLTLEERDARVAAQAEKRNRLIAAMGEQRYAEYEHESSFQNSSLREVAEKYNVPREQAFQALDVRWATQEQAMLLRTNPSLSDQQRHEMLLALRAQLESSLQQILPPPAYASYMKRRHGWMSVFPAPPSK